MGMLDDTAIFREVVKQGGFSHAARMLGLSNGLVSRKIAQLESTLGVTLIRRTTRQLQLTAEGEIFWKHAQRIQQELDTALSILQSSRTKPKGTIRISAPLHFGRFYLTPVLTKFLNDFDEITIDLELSNQPLDLIQKDLDLVIRGTGFMDDAFFPDSGIKMKLLVTDKIGLYASPGYLSKWGEPQSIEDLKHHAIIHFSTQKNIENPAWECTDGNIKKSVTLTTKFSSNDIGSNLTACMAGEGIARFTQFNARESLENRLLNPVLQKYDWGSYYLSIMYQQKALPKRTRLLLDFICAHIGKDNSI